MIDIARRIEAFARLGKFMKLFAVKHPPEAKNDPLYEKYGEKMEEAITLAYQFNGWFTEENVRHAMGAIGDSLAKDKLEKWVGAYSIDDKRPPKRVGVVMAGNVPMVGFHDMLCVLVSGNTFVGKLSSGDKLLLPQVAEVLLQIEPGFRDRVIFSEGILKDIDAVIATGSNNTSRYFEHYFGKYPNIIRKNRSSVAVLDGSETDDELHALGRDIFLYFGLGCRNVSKIFIPATFDLNRLFGAIYAYRDVVNNKKYGNNYDYHKTLFLLKGAESLIENGFLLVKEDMGLTSPVATLFYERYSDEDELRSRLRMNLPNIQCIVSKKELFPGTVAPGQAQTPELWDYADRVDTMKFLLAL
jgi:hypothetical protein